MGHNRSFGEIMGDKGQQGPDPMLMRKEGRLVDQRVIEQLVHRRPVDAEPAQDGVEVPAGNGKGTPAAVEMVRTQNDNAAVIMSLNPGEGGGDQVRGQQMMRDGDAGDFLG